MEYLTSEAIYQWIHDPLEHCLLKKNQARSGIFKVLHDINIL